MAFQACLEVADQGARFDVEAGVIAAELGAPRV
jgi:hypothetical protein